MMSCTCFENEGSSLGRRLYMQLWCGMLYMHRYKQSCRWRVCCSALYKKHQKRGKLATSVVVWRRVKQNVTCCINISVNKFMFSFLPVKLPSHLPPHQLIRECCKTSSPTSFSSPKINFHKRTNEISMLPSVIGIDQVAAEIQMQINDVRNIVTLKDSLQQGHTLLGVIQGIVLRLVHSGCFRQGEIVIPVLIPTIFSCS